MARRSVETSSSQSKPSRQAVVAEERGENPGVEMVRPAWLVVLAAVAALAAGLTAAGSMGLMAHPLRHVLTLVLMAAAALACRPDCASRWRGRALVLLALVGGGAMTGSALAPAGALGVVVLLAGLSLVRHAADRRVLLSASLAVFVLSVYRLACTSSGTLWLAADGLGRLLGTLGGAVTDRALWIGSTFGGVDVLVMSVALCVAWVVSGRGRRYVRIAVALAAIVAVHVAYLALVSVAVELQQGLKEIDPDGWWSWASDLHRLLPWSLPAVAGVVHLALAAVTLRLTALPVGDRPLEGNDDSQTGKEIGLLVAGGPKRWGGALRWLAVGALAVALPLVATITIGEVSLAGKKIVLYEKCYGNWERARHGDYGRLSVGMYGMMPAHLEALGARWVVTRDLSAADLDGADALVMIYPHKPWQGEQTDRIEQYVRNGGSLLVMGEHTTREKEGGARFNDLLEPTAMRVRFDSSMSAIGGWLQSYEALTHPASAGMGDGENEFAVVTGASVETRWPAGPLLIGRWGWNDPGDASDEAKNPSMMGNHQYDNGEKLGDVVLAAEQPLGDGTVIAFGDTSGLSNGLMIDSYQYVYRLLGYLACRPSGPQAMWRQILTMLLAISLAALVWWRSTPVLTIVAAVVVAGSLTLSVNTSHRGATMLPDGRGLALPDVSAELAKLPDEEKGAVSGDSATTRPAAPTRRGMLAYVDSTHMSKAAEESWRDDGLMGLMLTLMRSGYLTLGLHEFTPERLERAGLLISVAPRRAFSQAEIAMVKTFVENGGIFISTVGYEDRGPSEALLAAFGLRVGLRDLPDSEPQALGHYKSPYLNFGTHMAYVRYHSGWEVVSTEGEATDVAYARNHDGGRVEGDPKAIIKKLVGRGTVVLIGDTGFAMNKNLERVDGWPIEGQRENAEFWRWLLADLSGGPQWLPPPPPAPPKVQPPDDDADNEEVTP